VAISEQFILLVFKVRMPGLHSPGKERSFAAENCSRTLKATKGACLVPFVIAIDGPAGAGKSTVARRVARALDFTYLDTGAMYRSVAWKALESGVAASNVAGLEAIACALEVRFSPVAPDGSQRVWVGSEEVTQAIRTPQVTDVTSQISVVALVRAVIVRQQRRIADTAPIGVVLEGRDIGTVVFPDAQLKVFLTASPSERARRRVEEMWARTTPFPN
jgi:cytidylate kinase